MINANSLIFVVPPPETPGTAGTRQLHKPCVCVYVYVYVYECNTTFQHTASCDPRHCLTTSPTCTVAFKPWLLQHSTPAVNTPAPAQQQQQQQQHISAATNTPAPPQQQQQQQQHMRGQGGRLAVAAAGVGVGAGEPGRANYVTAGSTSDASCLRGTVTVNQMHGHCGLPSCLSLLLLLCFVWGI
jgi:hypothetical protein